MLGQSDGSHSHRVGAGRGRVLLVIRLLADRRGGAERVYAELAQTLSSAGYEVTCAYCDSATTGSAYRLPPDVRTINLYRPARQRSGFERLLLTLARSYPRVKALAPIAWLSRNVSFIRSLKGLIAETCPDAVISFLPSANTPSLIAGAICRTNVIVTNHGEPEHDYRSSARWDQNPFDRWLRYRALWLAARIQVLSPVHGEWFPKSLRLRTVAIPNALAAEFAQPASSVRREYTIIAVGRLVPEKGHSALVEAFSSLADRFPDWSVRIYGEGPERRKLAEQIRSCGLTDRVHLMGQTAEIRQAYGTAKLFCHPARHEGFGLAMLEALACGLPVVALAQCGAARRLVRDEVNGLLASGDNEVAALAVALERLISDESLQQRLALAAPGSIEEFSTEQFGARWCAVVGGLIGGETHEQRSRRLAA